MAATPEQSARTAQGWSNYVAGLLVFALGVALLLAAFYWGYALLQGVDEAMRSVQLTRAVENPAASQTGKPGEKPSVVAQASPPAQGQPTLLEVASTHVLKLVILLVLAAIGAMTASRGAQLAGMRVG